MDQHRIIGKSKFVVFHNRSEFEKLSSQFFQDFIPFKPIHHGQEGEKLRYSASRDPRDPQRIEKYQFYD